MKILVISLAGIGDTLFATPMIHELRARFPEATIDVTVKEAGARDLLENNPHLNRVIYQDLLKSGKLEAWRFFRSLRKNRYDLSINTHPQSRMVYRIAARIVGARTRLSHEYECFTWLDRRLVTSTMPQDYSRHAVDNNLSLLSLIGLKPILPRHNYEIFLTDAEKVMAENFIAKENIATRLLLGIHVGSGGTKNLALRRWPLVNYIELTRRLRQSKPGLAILFFGGPGEKPAHEQIKSALNDNQVFFPQTENIRQTAALIGKCDLFLSVDTALMHLAATMKVKEQIVIETPTWNKPVEPYGRPFTLIKNPAVAGRNLEFYRYDGRGIRGSPGELEQYMNSVTVGEVLAAVDLVLAKSI